MRVEVARRVLNEKEGINVELVNGARMTKCACVLRHTYALVRVRILSARIVVCAWRAVRSGKSFARGGFKAARRGFGESVKAGAGKIGVAPVRQGRFAEKAQRLPRGTSILNTPLRRQIIWSTRCGARNVGR